MSNTGTTNQGFNISGKPQKPAGMMIKKKRLNQGDGLKAFLFLLPSLTGFIAFVLFPVLFSLVLGFTKWSFAQDLSTMKFVGLNNFKDLMDDVWFKGSFKNSIIFTFSVVPFSIVFGLLFGVLINKFVYFKSYFKVTIFMPYISSTVASAVVWRMLLAPSNGPVNGFLMSIGIADPPKWFGDLKWSLFSVILFTIWQTFGYNVIVYCSGLQGIPSDLYEAAEIDGAGEIQKFMHITIPMVSPTTFFLAITGIITSFKAFDQIQVLTNGGPGTSSSVLVYYIYRFAFEKYQMGYASAAAWILFTIIFMVTIIQWIYQRKWVSYDG